MKPFAPPPVATPPLDRAVRGRARVTNAPYREAAGEDRAASPLPSFSSRPSPKALSLAREKTMTSSNKTKIFIDGQHGTTGLQIHDRLKDRPDIELLELPMADRKDLAKRAEIARAADIAVLCLPDAAAKELVAALGDADTVRDRRQHRPSRRRRLDLRLPRARQGPSPEAARLQAHHQSRAATRPARSRSCGRWSTPASCAPIRRPRCSACRATPAAARS